jgi:hypothetical protein
MNSMPGEDDSSSPYLFSRLIFCGYGLSKAHAGATAVLVDEFHADGF